MTDRKHLRKLAEEAIWNNDPEDWPTPEGVGFADDESNAYVSALSPAVVLDLLDELERQRGINRRAELQTQESERRVDALQARIDEAASPAAREVGVTGQIVRASFEDGELVPCGMDNCECPEHDSPSPSAGLYVTVRLDDEDAPVGFWQVRVTREVTA